ncbi:MAG: DNA polymerase III subunit beta [Gammaproteobacteria bacterium]|nr:MAG: DNA polymerase III subunit beta [Gammaproteobacteria bacterium]
MKFSVSREEFLKPLQLVVGVVERRQTLPILSNVLISLKDGRLSLTGTDLEVEIIGQLMLDNITDEGEITVPARKLMDICRSLPEGSELSLQEESAGRLLITSGRSRFTLSTLPASEFPSVDGGPGNCEFKIDQGLFKQLLDSTAFAMAQQDVRYYLNGMLLEVGGGRLRAVATDGHRLAMKDAPLPGVDQAPSQAIVPRKAVIELSRLMGGEGEVTAVLGNNHIRVTTPECCFTSKLVDGAYPDYERVLPKGGDKPLTGNREDLRHAFSRTSILSNEKYRGVRLILDDGILTMTANNPEQEEAQEEVVVNYNSGELEVGFNVSYIIDVLNVLRGQDVQFILSDANSSALMLDPKDESAAYVVMPMRL